jgi:anti-anti-sigma regulatory factor
MVTTALNTAKGNLSLPEFCFSMDRIKGLDEVQKAKKDVRESIGRGLKTLDLDFRSVRGVSSDIINFLIWCQMECNRNGVLLTARHVDPQMLRIFRFAGLNQVIEFRD